MNNGTKTKGFTTRLMTWQVRSILTVALGLPVCLVAAYLLINAHIPNPKSVIPLTMIVLIGALVLSGRTLAKKIMRSRSD